MNGYYISPGWDFDWMNCIYVPGLEGLLVDWMKGKISSDHLSTPLDIVSIGKWEKWLKTKTLLTGVLQAEEKLEELCSTHMLSSNV